MLETFITSKIRREILAKFLLVPKASYHIRDLGRLVGTEINAVRRELIHLDKAGFLKKRHSGNRLYYEISRDFILFNELIKIFAFDYGFGKTLIKNKEKLGRTRFALISLEFLKGRVSNSSQIDLLIVGNINQTVLEPIIIAEQGRLEHELNYMMLTEAEFNFQKKRRDPLLMGTLGQARLILWGDEQKYCGLV